MHVGSHIARPSNAPELPSNLLAASVSQLLEPQDRCRWEAALSQSARHFDREVDIVRRGKRPETFCVVLSGWVQRYKQLADGRRQIIALILPGEVCDLDLFTLNRRDSSLAALGGASVAMLNAREAISLFQTLPAVNAVITRSQLVGLAIQNEWLTSLGCRDALERVAHLLCELFVRQRGIRDDGMCDFPMTQANVAEATGITSVHVNRTLKRLRLSTAIEIRDRRMIVPNFKELATIAGFDAGYLHLGETGLVENRTGHLLRVAGGGQHACNAPRFEQPPNKRPLAF